MSASIHNSSDASTSRSQRHDPQATPPVFGSLIHKVLFILILSAVAAQLVALSRATMHDSMNNYDLESIEHYLQSQNKGLQPVDSTATRVSTASLSSTASRLKSLASKVTESTPPPATAEVSEVVEGSAAVVQEGSLSSASTLTSSPAQPQSASMHRIQKQQPNLTNTKQTTHQPNYHIAFSTSCDSQQDWESLAFFYQAYKVKQPGTVTRILSGCSSPSKLDAQWAFFDKYIRPLAPTQFHLHVTPDFTRVALEDGKHPYKYMNKPYGLRHWMENALKLTSPDVTPFHDIYNHTLDNEDDSHFHSIFRNMTVSEDDIIILMDPDMVLLQPIGHDFRNKSSHLFAKNDSDIDPDRLVVRHGNPMAQQDAYLTSSWIKLNMSYILQKPQGEYVATPPEDDGPLYWNTGPPYLMTVRDGYKIACKWTEYAPRILEIFPHLYSEMYGYIIATVQLGLPHTLIKSLVLSYVPST
jgi:hypothetical protein